MFWGVPFGDTFGSETLGFRGGFHRSDNVGSICIMLRYTQAFWKVWGVPELGMFGLRDSIAQFCGYGVYSQRFQGPPEASRRPQPLA